MFPGPFFVSSSSSEFVARNILYPDTLGLREFPGSFCIENHEFNIVGVFTEDD